MTTNLYQSPLGQRYASQDMLFLFSPQYKHSTWRRLWIVLAEEQRKLGLSISQQQIQELKDHVDSIDFERAAEWEKSLRHDVMAHVHTYGEQCPLAKPIIHLGATSCYVTDNSELIQLRSGMRILQKKLVQLLKQLKRFAWEQRETACLGFTHFQPAQLTTVGKRACLWTQDFLLDLQELNHRIERLGFLGAKGTTGTQASFLALFQEDHEKVKLLDRRIANRFGFEVLLPISGQTYTRKQDSQVLDMLTGIAQSAHKMASDLRLLANLREVEEPFEEGQIGSSAMPYKRNPMRSERICALSRFLISLGENPKYTAATQWLERSLDDSANRRLCLSESFLCCDAILNLLLNVSSGLVVNQAVIQKNVQRDLPFMATENILMAAVQKGGDRQALHERLRIHSREAGAQLREGGEKNDLFHRILSDPEFPFSEKELDEITSVKDFIGRAPEQVEEFIRDDLDSQLEPFVNLETQKIELTV